MYSVFNCCGIVSDSLQAPAQGGQGPGSPRPEIASSTIPVDVNLIDTLSA